MTRIISGSAGGRRIATPAGSGTRPTSDRVREAIFSRLGHLDVLDGASVVDLYAGSGALGLEALSRGAERAVFVESHRRTASLVRRNAADLGFRDVQVVCEPVERAVARAPLGGPADVVLCDPPYDVPEERLAGILADLVAQGWIAPGAVLVVERSSRSPEPRWPAGVVSRAGKTYGETTVWYADEDAQEPDGPGADGDPAGASGDGLDGAAPGTPADGPRG